MRLPTIARALLLRTERSVSLALDAPAQVVEAPAVEEKLTQLGSFSVPLPEAPVSCNVHVQIAGRDVLVTLRGTDEAEVLARLEALLTRYPLPAATTPSEKLCPKHHVPMKENHKEGRTWWSHRNGDGGWCRGK